MSFVGGDTGGDDSVYSLDEYLQQTQTEIAAGAAAAGSTGAVDYTPPVVAGGSTVNTVSASAGNTVSASAGSSGGATAMNDDATWLDDIGTGIEMVVLGPLQVLTPGFWQGISDGSGGGAGSIADQITSGVQQVGQGVASSVGASLPSEGEVIAGVLALIIILVLVAYIVRETVG